MTENQKLSRCQLCHHWCHLWWQSWHHDNFRFSVAISDQWSVQMAWWEQLITVISYGGKYIYFQGPIFIWIPIYIIHTYFNILWILELYRWNSVHTQLIHLLVRRFWKIGKNLCEFSGSWSKKKYNKQNTFCHSFIGLCLVTGLDNGIVLFVTRLVITNYPANCSTPILHDKVIPCCAELI